MRRLINTYPKHDKVDKVLQHLGEDFAHDAIHDLSGAEEDDGDNSEAAASDGEGETAVAAAQSERLNASAKAPTYAAYVDVPHNAEREATIKSLDARGMDEGVSCVDVTVDRQPTHRQQTHRPQTHRPQTHRPAQAANAWTEWSWNERNGWCWNPSNGWWSWNPSNGWWG